MPKANALAQHLPVLDRLALWTMAARAFRVILDTVDIIFVDWDRWKIKVPAMGSMDWAPACDVDGVEINDELDTYIVTLQDYNVEAALKMRVAYDRRSATLFVAKRGHTITVPLNTPNMQSVGFNEPSGFPVVSWREWGNTLKAVAKTLWPVIDYGDPGLDRSTTRVTMQLNSEISDQRLATAKWTEFSRDTNADVTIDKVEVRWFGNGGLAYSEKLDELLIIIDDTHGLI
jgi:hypothetical protein